MTDGWRGGRSAQSGWALRWLAAILIGLVGMALVVSPSVQDGRISGDIYDGRFNAYLLEHVYRWMVGLDRSFWSADIFYPYPLTIAFSDNYLGNGPVYALFRALGLDREDAFRAWYVAGFVLNFIASTYVLLRLGYSGWAAGFGAFLFTFGLPMTQQQGHAQLVYRFAVPLAVLPMLGLSTDKPLRQLAYSGFWTVWQFYCSIYMGYFLCLLLLALLAARALCAEGGALAGMRAAPALLLHTWKAQPARARWEFAGACLVLAALLGVLFFPYLRAAHLYHLSRPWWEISSFLPRPASYLLSNNSLLWPSSGWLFQGVPNKGEHSMFVGIASYLAIMVGIILRWRKWSAPDRLFRPVAVSLVLVVAVTLWVHGHTLYRPLTGLPGVGSIRAVSRIIVVELFPFGILLASSLDAIAAARLPATVRFAGIALIAGMLVFESSYIGQFTSTKSEWRARIAALEAMLPAQLPSAPILLVGPRAGENWIPSELDAMLLAQDRGWRTINGYSGYFPTGFKIEGRCETGLRRLAEGIEFKNQITQGRLFRARMAVMSLLGMSQDDQKPLDYKAEASQLLVLNCPNPAASH